MDMLRSEEAVLCNALRKFKVHNGANDPLIMGALKIFAEIFWLYVSRLLLRKLTLDISLKFGNTQIYLPIGS